MGNLSVKPGNETHNDSGNKQYDPTTSDVHVMNAVPVSKNQETKRSQSKPNFTTSPVSSVQPGRGNVDSATSAYLTSEQQPVQRQPAQRQPAQSQSGGNYVESEIDVQIEDIPINNMRGGNVNFGPESSEFESSIQIETVDIANNNLTGGGVDSEFDSNKLLNTIMQLGGDMESSESESGSENSDIFTATPTSHNNTTSSFEQKPAKKNKPAKKVRTIIPDDSPSDSDSSSDSDSDSLDLDDDDDSLEHDPDTPIDTETVLMRSHNNMVSSDVYIMSDSDSANNRGITLMSFNDPLNYGKAKKTKKSKSKK